MEIQTHDVPPSPPKEGCFRPTGQRCRLGLGMDQPPRRRLTGGGNFVEFWIRRLLGRAWRSDDL